MFHSGGQHYPKHYVMTAGVDFCVKMVNIPDTNVAVELYLYDCAGQSIFNQLDHMSKHWENTSQVVVCYDVSSRESFQSCAKWLQGVRGVRPANPVGGVLLANKIDLRETGRAVVDAEEGVEFAQANGLEYYECSALTGGAVDEPFNYIANTFYKKYEESVSRAEDLA
jgi:transport family protein 27